MNDYRKNRLISISRDLMPKLRSGRSFHVSFILNKNQLLTFATNDYSNLHLAHKFGVYKALRSAENYIVSRHSEVCALKTYLNKFGNIDMSGLK